MNNSKLKVIISFLGVLLFIFAVTIPITLIFKGHSEKISTPQNIIISQDMNAVKIAEQNLIKVDSVKEALKIDSEEELNKSLNELGISTDDARDKLTKQLNFEAEEASKNAPLIIIKFILWAVFMIIAFKLLRSSKMTSKIRKAMLLISFILFGAILGAEPNSMSTVKDMITAYAIKGIIFPPRLIAMLVFLGVVLFANKLVCGWACQFGTLQDFIFRLNRTSNDKRGIIGQIKVPFRISNVIRIIFFAVFVAAAFAFSTDIIEKINPFAIFSPLALTTLIIVFLVIILGTSLFIYRPWCHFFCPFGLVGWLIEKISINKINVNSSTCTNCKECTKVCPSYAMEGILNNKKQKPDCFSCGSCINACPTKSINYGRAKKEKK